MDKNSINKKRKEQKAKIQKMYETWKNTPKTHSKTKVQPIDTELIPDSIWNELLYNNPINRTFNTIEITNLFGKIVRLLEGMTVSMNTFEEKIAELTERIETLEENHK